MRRSARIGPDTVAVSVADRAAALATELARVRQRGIDRVDLNRDRHRPLTLPLLDAAADIDPADASRALTFATFLRSQLQTYGIHHHDGAAFIQRLFFDGTGASPGPGGPSALLHDARRDQHLSASAFRRLQREQFLAFATFLLIEPDQRSPLPMRLALLGLFTAVAMGAAIGFFLR